MKRKQKITLFMGISVLAVGALSIAFNADTLFANNKMFTGAQCEVCSGNHYSGEGWDTNNKAKGSNGLYEYWHCCQCGKRYFFQEDIPGYDAKNWKDNGTRNQYMDTSDLDDSRIQFGGTSKLHKINHLTSGTITVDGTRDELYNAAAKYDFGPAMYKDSKVTATLEAVWQEDMLYVFVNVYDPTKTTRDFTKQDTSKWTEAYDAVELRIDTLHSEKYADSSWNGKQSDKYRGEYACEGFFKAGAGYNRDEQYGDGIGCEYVWDYYMSNICRNDGKTYIKSSYTDDTHYGMEFAISLSNAHSVMNPFGEIGLGIKIYDRNGENNDNGIINFETINDDMNYHRNFSNFRLIGYGETTPSDAAENVVNEIKANASASDWTFSGNKVTTNSVGTYLSNTSYDNFTAKLKFENYSQDTSGNGNPYFSHKATKSFLFGGAINESTYTGYALNISKDWIQLLSLSGYDSTFIDGVSIDLGDSEIEVTMSGNIFTVRNASKELISMTMSGKANREALSNYAGGQIGLLCNDTTATTISLVEFYNNNEYDPASFELPRGINLVNDIKANNSSSDWSFTGNKITTNSVGHVLSTASYTNFTAVVNFDTINPSSEADANPFWSKIATKAFLFGGSNDETGKYTGYALNVSYGFIEVLKLDGYASTCLDYIELNPENVCLRLTVSETSLSLAFANGNILGTYATNDALTLALDGYTGGHVGILSNDTFATNVSIFEIK